SERVEEALWTAMNALEEIAALAQRMSRHAEQRNQASIARRFEARAASVRQRAEIIRQVLQSGDGGGASEFEPVRRAPDLAREE
ncbi:MAG TPA: hypothetical protein VGM03_22455, partial [Phycisphaerae bacterium]